jgi:hypothetical protein
VLGRREPSVVSYEDGHHLKLMPFAVPVAAYSSAYATQVHVAGVLLFDFTTLLRAIVGRNATIVVMIELNRILRTEGGVTGWGIVLYWFEAAPPDAADKGFARFRSYIPNFMVALMVAVLCEALSEQV